MHAAAHSLGLGTEIARVAERVSRSVVQVHCRSGGGSGVVWRRDGLLITNAHVMQRRKATVTVWDGTEFKARLCAYDAGRDLAALRVEAHHLTPIQKGDVQTLRVGQIVFALGNPHGSERALSAGVIHAIGPMQGQHRQAWLQADLTLHPGNSGGPLFDTSGAVVGINSMIMHGLALAVPVWAVDELIAPAVPRQKLGIQCEAVQLTTQRFARLDLTSCEALLIVAVAPNSLAEKAGLGIGDVISGVSLRGKLLRPAAELEEVLSGSRQGEVLTLEIVRGGKRESRDVLFNCAPLRQTEAA